MTETLERISATPARDPLRDEEWFSIQIGKSLDWCRKNRHELPHHIVGASPRYDDHCVDIYREQTFKPVDAPVVVPGSGIDLSSVGPLRRTERSHRGSA